MEKNTITIVGSYSENISPENHGLQGMRFENRSFFLSVSDNLLQDEATSEQIKEIGKKIHEMCKAVVKESAITEIRDLQKNAGLKVDLTNKEREQIANIIAAYDVVVTEEDYNKAKALEDEIKNKLNDVQLDYLKVLRAAANTRAVKK